jgi:hypothetical protein
MYRKAIFVFLFFANFFSSFSQLRSVDCSRVSTPLTQELYAAFTGAVQYKFKVRNQFTNVTDSIISADRSFRLNELPSIARYNCTYDVYVSMDTGSGFGPYSSVCHPVTSPLVTTLRDTDCGKVLLTMFNPVYANQLTADSWDFEIQLGTDASVTQLITNRPSREFSLSLANNSFRLYNTEIKIRCRTVQGGVTQPWGSWCSFYTPNLSPPTITSGCGTTFEYLAYEYITCSTVPGAIQYRWRLRSGSTVVDLQTTTATQITIADFLTDAMVPAYSYNKTYNISVQAFDGTAWTSYGTACTVKTTHHPHAEVQHLCNQTLATFSQPISVYAIFNATSYQFEVNDLTASAENDGIQTYSTTTRTFKLSDLPIWSYGHEYSVRCRVVFKSVLYPYSAACSVFAPPAITTLRVADCPKTLSSKATKVYANTMTTDNPQSVTGYQFKIGAQESAWKTTRDVTIQEIIGSVPASNTAYPIQVRLMYEGVAQAYGAACTVTTPNALIVIDDSTIDESENDIFDDKAAGIEEDILNDFQVFPNPSDDQFTIRLSGDLENEPILVEVYDFSGRKLLSIEEKTDSSNEVTFGKGLERGNYILQIQRVGILQKKKIIKL